MAKKRIPKLCIEDVNDRGNLLYLSLLEYRKVQYLCIIDNISEDEIGAYILDYAEQEQIPVADFLSIVTKWFYSKSESSPLSVEIAKLGLTNAVAPMFRTFESSYVVRIVGKAFSFRNTTATKVKRRRVIPLQEGIPITLKKKA
jgi:hypothetical protein